MGSTPTKLLQVRMKDFEVFASLQRHLNEKSPILTNNQDLFKILIEFYISANDIELNNNGGFE